MLPGSFNNPVKCFEMIQVDQSAADARFVVHSLYDVTHKVEVVVNGAVFSDQTIYMY